jgi:cell division protein FtsL
MRVMFLLLISIFISGCATVQETGRQRLSIISDQQLISAANQEFSKFHQKLIAENRILRDSESAEAARILNTVKIAS